MTDTDPRYEARARRLLSVVRANPGIWKNELVRKACIARPIAKDTVDRMLEDGLLMLEEASGRHAYHPGVNADEFANAVDDEKKAALVDPELHEVRAPAGYRLRGVSSLVRGDGSVINQWVKTEKLRDDPIAALELFTAVAEERIRPSEPVPDTTVDTSPDMLAVLPLGDPHIGMLAWHLECGKDFDLRIAQHNLTTAVRKLVALTPPCERALLISVGDTFHADNLDSRTSRGTHQLDTDNRLPKVVRIGLEIFVDMIDCALTRHRFVDVIVAPGNHDYLTSLHFALMLAIYYRNEPRVSVDTSPGAHHYYEFGKCLIGVTHGDKVKMSQLGQLMSVDMAEQWGRTKYRHWYTGHIHHEVVKELMGCTAEAVRTLAATDAYHHAHGYRSGRSMFADVWHREHGHRLRHTVGIEEIERR